LIEKKALLKDEAWHRWGVRRTCRADLKQFLDGAANVFKGTLS